MSITAAVSIGRHREPPPAPALADVARRLRVERAQATLVQDRVRLGVELARVDLLIASEIGRRV